MIEVGDIVKTKNKEGKVVIPAVVTKVNTYKSGNIYGNSEVKIIDINVLFSDGTHGSRTPKNFKETGRHIDIQSVLDSIE